MRTLNKKQQRLLEKFKSNFALKFYFLKYIPSLLFWRTKIVHIDVSGSIVSIPYSWRTQNPFRSIYFGTQLGAAELSTGVLVLLATQSHDISSLVTGVEGKFFKKATSLTKFYCEDGDKIFTAIEKALETGEGQTVTALSKGVRKNGEVVSEFKITWSFRKRKKE